MNTLTYIFFIIVGILLLYIYASKLPPPPALKDYMDKLEKGETVESFEDYLQENLTATPAGLTSMFCWNLPENQCINSPGCEWTITNEGYSHCQPRTQWYNPWYSGWNNWYDRYLSTYRWRYPYYNWYNTYPGYYNSYYYSYPRWRSYGHGGRRWRHRRRYHHQGGGGRRRYGVGHSGARRARARMGGRSRGGGSGRGGRR